MTAPLSVEVVRQGNAVVAHLRGEIDVTSVGEVRDAIEPFLAPSQTVILDLNEVSFLDSSLLNVLVQARGEMSKAGGELYLRNPSEQARRLLTIAELDDLLQTEMNRQNTNGD